jgi:hypothetical protein
MKVGKQPGQSKKSNVDKDPYEKTSFNDESPKKTKTTITAYDEYTLNKESLI